MIHRAKFWAGHEVPTWWDVLFHPGWFLALLSGLGILWIYWEIKRLIADIIK